MCTGTFVTHRWNNKHKWFVSSRAPVQYDMTTFSRNVSQRDERKRKRRQADAWVLFSKNFVWFSASGWVLRGKNEAAVRVAVVTDAGNTGTAFRRFLHGSFKRPAYAERHSIQNGVKISCCEYNNRKKITLNLVHLRDSECLSVFSVVISTTWRVTSYTWTFGKTILCITS